MQVTDKAGRDLVSIAAKAGAYGPLRLLLDLAQRRTATRANTGKVSRQVWLPHTSSSQPPCQREHCWEGRGTPAWPCLVPHH